MTRITHKRYFVALLQIKNYFCGYRKFGNVSDASLVSAMGLDGVIEALRREERPKWLIMNWSLGFLEPQCTVHGVGTRWFLWYLNWDDLAHNYQNGKGTLQSRRTGDAKCLLFNSLRKYYILCHLWTNVFNEQIKLNKTDISISDCTRCLADIQPCTCRHFPG